jgi:hypothetical protein
MEQPLIRLALLATFSPRCGERKKPAARILASRFSVRGLIIIAPTKREGRAGRRVINSPAGFGTSRRQSGTMLFDEAPSG